MQGFKFGLVKSNYCWPITRDKKVRYLSVLIHELKVRSGLRCRAKRELLRMIERLRPQNQGFDCLKPRL